MPKLKPAENGLLNKLDRLPASEKFFIKIEKAISSVSEFYGFEKIYTSPLDEQRFYKPLIKGGLFENWHPVFGKSRGGVDIFLRPSAALSLIRAYITHKMNDLPHPVKLFFTGESFFSLNRAASSLVARSELGLVMIGEEGPVAEAEIVQVFWRAVEKLGIKEGIEIRTNATGCLDCRVAFRSSFAGHFRSRIARLCKNCKRDFKKTPTEILLCQEEKCKIVGGGAPQVLDFLCETCKKHLRGFLEFLEEVKIPYFLDPKFFGDNPWFDTLIFEFVWKAKINDGEEKKGSQLVFAEGGRMSRAGTLMAGRKLDVAAVSVFFEVLGALLSSKAGGQEIGNEPKVFLTHLGDLAKRKGLSLLEELRQGGIDARESLGRDSIKSQLNLAEKMGAPLALILGQKEVLDNTVIVREVQSGIQETIPQEKLIEFLKKRLKRP